MPQTKAHIRATTKYENKALDKVCLRIRKDGDLTREMIAEMAEKQGESLNQFIMTAVRERIDRIK
jgi:predicted HicB family RNase H-like nuclease